MMRVPMGRVLTTIVSVALCWRAWICAAQPAAGTQPPGTHGDYLADVRRTLDDAWKPGERSRAHLRGRSHGPSTARLQISIAADGALREVIVESSSGLPPFDDAAVRAVRTIQRFPAPPGELLDPASAVFSFPFTFHAPGWQLPQYAGDALVRTPHTQSWEVGSSVDLQRRATALSGRAAIPARASYDRTTLTVTASHQIDAIGLIELQVPVAAIRYREPAAGASTEVSGLGDVALHFHRFRRSGRWSSGFFVGVRIPTGATAAMPLVGQALPTVVQLGSGTLDPEFGGCLNLQLNARTSLSACDHGSAALYTNAHDYRDPYVFQARLFLAMPFLDRHVSAQAGLLYEAQGIARWQGQELASSGHRELFAEASIWLSLRRGLSLRSTIELPMDETVHGMQLADTLRVMAGLSYDFDIDR
jgi:TonB family protein